MTDVPFAISFLFSQSGLSLIAIFGFTIFLEIPRYGFPFVAVALEPLTRRWGASITRQASAAPPDQPLRVSVIVVGHSEADALEACVCSLRDQSMASFEIVVVSDGSNDAMATVANRLLKQGLIARVLATDIRGGKSAGLNLAIRYATGDIIINVDCDCSFDHYAIENILKEFADPRLAAACGDVVPRNSDASLMAKFQAIEYLLAISVGKRIGAAIDQVVCMSGAFSAFRRSALDEIGGFDIGGGEDLDITLRLRARGWRVGFAADAVCYTDVPTAAWTLSRQRMRWERDSVRLRYRKFRDTMLPGTTRFSLGEALHQWEFLIFSVAGAILFPFYVVWLFLLYGDFAFVVLVAMQVGLLTLDVVMLSLAAHITGRDVFWPNLVYMPGFSLFTSYYMRIVRLCAYVHEWVFIGSFQDNYVPEKVRLERKW